MKCMIVISCLVALAAANPGYLGLGAPAIAHTAYAAAPVAYSAIVAPGAVTSQYHTQDTLGQYAYGYQGDTSAKQEVRTADGITQGAYSYVDAHGLVQSASYVSDPLNGFRVAATNDPSLPASAGHAVVAAAPAVAAVAAPAHIAAAPGIVAADAVEITAARAAHFNAHVAAKAALLGRKRRSPGYVSAAAPIAVAHAAAPVAVAHAAPAVVAAAPAVVAAPVSTFGYSSVSAHPATVVGYAAHAAPVAVAHAAPVSYADAAHIAAKAALLGRKKRSPGFLHSAAVAAPLAYAAPIATTTYAHAPIATTYAHAPIATTYAHAPIFAY